MNIKEPFLLSNLKLKRRKQLKSEKRAKLTILFEIAAGINGIEFIDGLIGRRRMRDLEGIDFDGVRSTRAGAEQVRVRNDAEGLVVLDDAAFIVPHGAGIVDIDEGPELRRESEARLEDVRVFPRKTHFHLRTRLLVFPSRPPHRICSCFLLSFSKLLARVFARVLIDKFVFL